jgi:FKBP-type peptidyl-prolyl cis-trans isomerase 2
MAIQKGDFIQISYTGIVNDSTKLVFDTTHEEKAKETGLYDKKAKYGPVVIVVGENHVLPGLDNALVGASVGDHTIEVEAKEGFGIKSSKNLQLVPAKFFIKENLRPQVGLQVNIDDKIGVIRSVSGGRVIVDFNHPLASKDLIYEISVHKIVEDPNEQVVSLFKLFGLPTEQISVEGNKAVITTKMNLPAQFTKPLIETLTRLTTIETVEFKQTQDSQKELSAPEEQAHLSAPVKKEELSAPEVKKELPKPESKQE